jgi:hypothetical protein
MVLRHNNAALGSMDAIYLKGRRHKKPGGSGYGLGGITHREFRFPPVVPDKSFIAHSAQPEIKGKILQFLASGVKSQRPSGRLYADRAWRLGLYDNEQS